MNQLSNKEICYHFPYLICYAKDCKRCMVKYLVVNELDGVIFIDELN
jgi:hypothetical protein